MIGDLYYNNCPRQWTDGGHCVWDESRSRSGEIG